MFQRRGFIRLQPASSSFWSLPCPSFCAAWKKKNIIEK